MNARSRSTRRAISLLGLLAFTTALCAQQANAPQPAGSSGDVFTLKASTHLVVLDVAVLDWKGTPATGLTTDDFHLTEDGHDQTIKNIEEHAPLDAAVARERLAAVAAKLPPNTFTNFRPFPSTTVNVIVLDALTSPPAIQQDHHAQLVNYMKTVPPGIPFIIFKLDTQLHLVQGLSSDPAVLRAAVEVKPGEVFTSPNETWSQKRQIVTSAVDQLTRYLGGIPGHKTMMWFSYALGIALSSTGDHNDETEPDVLCKLTDDLQQNRIDVYRLGADPAGVSSGLGCKGGHKPGNTIAALVDGAAHFYTLSYTPTNANWNGKYRKIKVSASGKGTPWKGITLDYREGYYGRANDGSVRSSVVSAPSAGNAESIALRQAMSMGTPEPDDVVFEATVKPDAQIVKDPAGTPAQPGNFLSGPVRTQGYRAYAVHYAVRADQLHLIANSDQTAYAEKMEVVTVVYDSLGHPLNSKRSAVSVDFSGPDDPRLQTATITADVTTQVPATGSYFLRIGARDISIDRVGALEVPVDRIAVQPK